jgi:hypothetical protein
LVSTLGRIFQPGPLAIEREPPVFLWTAAFGPAMNTPHNSKPAGEKSTRDLPDLTRRAMSLHNRDRSGAERYLRLHQILSRKDCLND